MTKRKTKSFISFIVLLLLLLSVGITYAQQVDKKAFAILDKAFEGLGKKDNYAIYFDAIAMGIPAPAMIYKLAPYKYFKGGYLIMDKNKYEINIGVMKALCDGKLSVVVNELIRTMVIDSVRHAKETTDEVKSIKNFLNDNLKNQKLDYAGLEKLNNVLCHKVMMRFADTSRQHIIYWVTEKEGKLKMIAEWQNENYDVYTIRKIGLAPLKHKYAVMALPPRTIRSLKGYEVMDLRFINLLKN